MAKKKRSRKKTAERKGTPVAKIRAVRKSAYTLPADAIESALLTTEHRHLLESYFGEEAYVELQELALQASSRNVRGGSRVLILPGIMGSKLGYRGSWLDDTVWIDPFDIARGNLELLSTEHSDSSRIEALGVMQYAYLQLKLRLRIAGFNADFHPFDWRLSLDTLGTELKETIDKETAGSHAQGRYVYLVAHSMGGLVARSALAKLERDDQVRRLVMLGTPNFGSFAPVQALRGEYPTLQKVAALDQVNTVEELARNVFRTLPGLCELLPSREKFSSIDLYQATNWPANPVRPRQRDLDGITAVHASLHPGDDRFSMIAGVDQNTVTGLRLEDAGAGNTFRYIRTRNGDGTVPLDFAVLDAARTWYVAESHGSLPNNQSVIRATIDLLQRGTTSALSNSWDQPADRRTANLNPPEFELPALDDDGQAIPREVRNLLNDLVAPMSASAVTSAPAIRVQEHTSEISQEPIVIGRRRQHRIDVFLAQGDVTQVGSRAVVLGLFNDVDPAGAALAFDKRLDYAITEFTERRMFSGNTGEVFIMPTSRHQVRAEMLVFMGLGSFDSFDNDVVRMVAENASRTLVRTGVNEFATVLLGGNSSAGIRDQLAALVRGFLSGIRDADANHRMRSITICEKDCKRFELIRQELLHLAVTPLLDDVEISVESYDLPEAPELRDRTRVEQTGPEPCYLFVRRQSETFADPEQAETGDSADEQILLQSSVLTPAGNKATVVTDTKEVSSTELDSILAEVQQHDFNITSLQGKDGFGDRLVQLLLPDSVQRVLESVGQDHPLIVIHDALASRVPWETIALNEGDWFPAQTAGLSRKYAAENLSVAKWLESRRLDRILRILLVVNPTLDLPGAQAEGDRVAALLNAEGSIALTRIDGRDATWNRLHSELKSGEYDVLHYAGHAFFDPADRSRSGLICHGGRVLSGADLSGIGGLPTLAFFNACEAGRVRGTNRLTPGEFTAARDALRNRATASTTAQRDNLRERIDINVSLAEALLRGGIANYLGTYWPVGDAPAERFAETFYKRVLEGASLGDAILDARQTVYDLNSIDWADYIHYGSPQFRLKLRETQG
ncbi:MAG: pimeloyl-ACP methyl ester carboxylesterase [Planctomycetaceae bacterium]|jgi:pimeloyl-ACP methyl ester carboxylesterase